MLKNTNENDFKFVTKSSLKVLKMESKQTRIKVKMFRQWCERLTNFLLLKMQSGKNPKKVFVYPTAETSIPDPPDTIFQSAEIIFPFFILFSTSWFLIAGTHQNTQQRLCHICLDSRIKLTLFVWLFFLLIDFLVRICKYPTIDRTLEAHDDFVCVCRAHCCQTVSVNSKQKKGKSIIIDKAKSRSRKDIQRYGHDPTHFVDGAGTGKSFVMHAKTMNECTTLLPPSPFQATSLRSLCFSGTSACVQIHEIFRFLFCEIFCYFGYFCPL